MVAPRRLAIVPAPALLQKNLPAGVSTNQDTFPES